MQEHEKEKKKVNTGLIIAICIFMLSVTFSAVFFIVSSSKKSAAPSNQQQQSSEYIPSTENDPALPESNDPNEGLTTLPDDVKIVETSNDFPTGNLNNNSYPYYNYTPERYAVTVNTISSIDCVNGIPDSAAQEVKEAYACWLDLMEWDRPDHKLVIDNQQGDWYSVKDTTYDFDMWVNRDLNVCIDKCEGMDATTIYNCASAVFNYYDTAKLTIQCMPGDEDYMPVYVYQTGDIIVLKQGTWSVVGVTTYEEVQKNLGQSE